MSDDAFAKHIGELMHTQDEAFDPRLTRLADGSLTAEERARLDADAARDPVLAEAIALFAPMSPTTHRKLAATATLASRRPARPFRMIGGGATGLLLAAAVAGVFLRSSVDPLGGYQLSAQAGEVEWRSEAAKALAGREIHPQAELSLVLRPERATKHAVEGALWIQAGTTMVRAPLDARVSEEGAVAWFGPAEVITDGRRGSVQLIAVVGYAGRLPQTPQDIDSPRHQQGYWHSFRISLRVADSPSKPQLNQDSSP